MSHEHPLHMSTTQLAQHLRAAHGLANPLANVLTWGREEIEGRHDNEHQRVSGQRIATDICDEATAMFVLRGRG